MIGIMSAMKLIEAELKSEPNQKSHNRDVIVCEEIFL